VSSPIVIKKYSNRRLYDTQESHYITLDELASKVRAGIDVAVVDAKTGEDLTRTTLTQILMEERGAARMLPSDLLAQLIRMSDQALAEFLERYVAAALLLYMQNAQAGDPMSAFHALAGNLFADTPLSRMWALVAPGSRTGMGAPLWPPARRQPAQHRSEPIAVEPRSDAPSDLGHEMAELRRELEELKQLVLEGSETSRRSTSKRRSKGAQKP
jgi:polyhydroxyalkanoate synthesis repressor PhaR